MKQSLTIVSKYFTHLFFLLGALSLYPLSLWGEPSPTENAFLPDFHSIGTLEGRWDVGGNPKYTQFEARLNGIYPNLIQIAFQTPFSEHPQYNWKFTIELLLPLKYWNCTTHDPFIVFSQGHRYRLTFPYHGHQRCRPMNVEGTLFALPLLTSDDPKTARAVGQELLDNQYPRAIIDGDQKIDITSEHWYSTLRALKTLIRPYLDYRIHNRRTIDGVYP